MFVDELEFAVRAGKGGDGCVSFYREKCVQRGGPDGGDGGDGGHVVLIASPHCNTLYHLAGRRLYAAHNGEPGGSRKCFGKKAGDLRLEVPVGTIVLEATRGNVLKDLKVAGEEFVVARGGRGGRGNAVFATAVNRTPQEYERGKQGEEFDLRLSLKLIADVGLLGMPNAGKSTLLATLTRARPKIADYPFTTLEPMLGIAKGPGDSTFVLADIPGLIEGAHRGKGLGDRFLKHVERTRMLLHLVDCSALALQEPAEQFRIVRAELQGYGEELAGRPALVVASKVEDEESERRAGELAEAIGQPVLAISAATGRGLDQLSAAIVQRLAATPRG